MLYSLLSNSGAVLAITLSQSSTPFFLLVYIWACGLHKQTWGGRSWKCLVDWWTFTKLALPGLLMFSLKWWSNEVGIIIIGMIEKTELAIYTISVNITLFLFLVGLTSFIQPLCHILILLTSFPNDHLCTIFWYILFFCKYYPFLYLVCLRSAVASYNQAISVTCTSFHGLFNTPIKIPIFYFNRMDTTGTSHLEIVILDP